MVGINHPVSRTIQIKQGVLPKTRLNSDGGYIPECPGPFNALFIIANHHRLGIRFKTTTKIGPILPKLSFSFVEYDAKKIVKW
jgi:hypothetical protein